MRSFSFMDFLIMASIFKTKFRSKEAIIINLNICFWHGSEKCWMPSDIDTKELKSLRLVEFPRIGVVHKLRNIIRERASWKWWKFTHVFFTWLSEEKGLENVLWSMLIEISMQRIFTCFLLFIPHPFLWRLSGYFRKLLYVQAVYLPAIHFPWFNNKPRNCYSV